MKQRQLRLGVMLTTISFLISSCVSAQELFEKGVAAENIGQTLQAEQYYTASIQADNSFLKSYNNRGLLYLDQNRYTDAAKDFDAALKQNPNYALALVNRGLVYDKQGDIKSAYSFYKKATQADAQLLAAQFNAAKTALEFKDTQSSVHYIKAAMTIDPNDTSVRRLAARIYSATGQYNQSYQLFKELYEQDKTDEEALVSLIETGRRSGKSQEAIGYTESFVKAKPACSECVLLLSSLYFEGSRNDSAIAVVESAIDRMPNDAPLRFRLGLLYTKKGENDKAAPQLQEFLKLSKDQSGPDIETAKALLSAQKK